MINTKTIVLGALLAAIAVIFQTIPILFSEALVILTVFSALPIYIISRIQPKVGVAAYVVAGVLVLLISPHEGLFFLCTNGVVGCSLGICRHYIQKRHLIYIYSSLTLMITLIIMNYLIGIPVFGSKIPGAFIIQLIIIAIFSLTYSIIYNFFAEFIYNRIIKSAK